MPILRPWVTLSALLLLGAALGCVPPAALGQSSACLTADPRGSTFIGNLRALYADPRIDSLRWKAEGFPFATDTAIRLVTDNETCLSAVTAFNQASQRIGTPGAVTQVYVARVGSTGYVVMSPQETGPGEWYTNYWFTPKWVLKQQMAG
jgi:hypothetical protein